MRIDDKKMDYYKELGSGGDPGCPVPVKHVTLWFFDVLWVLFVMATESVCSWDAKCHMTQAGHQQRCDRTGPRCTWARTEWNVCKQVDCNRGVHKGSWTHDIIQPVDQHATLCKKILHNPSTS